MACDLNMAVKSILFLFVSMQTEEHKQDLGLESLKLEQPLRKVRNLSCYCLFVYVVCVQQKSTFFNIFGCVK